MDLEIHDVLPAAFYYLCAGFSLLMVDSGGYRTEQSRKNPGDISILTVNELRTCFTGGAALRSFLFLHCAVRKDNCPSLSDLSPGRNHINCHEDLLRMWDNLGNLHTRLSTASLQVYDLKCASELHTHNICPDCFRIANRRLKEMGETAWRQLPAIFELVCQVSQRR